MPENHPHKSAKILNNIVQLEEDYIEARRKICGHTMGAVYDITGTVNYYLEQVKTSRRAWTNTSWPIELCSRKDLVELAVPSITLHRIIRTRSRPVGFSPGRVN
jgi:hypothetical protein